MKFLFFTDYMRVIKKIKKFIFQYRAIFFIIGLGSINIGGVLYLFNISNNKNLEMISKSSLNTTQKAFNRIEINIDNMLSATIEALLINEEIGKCFSRRDRDDLYQIIHPFFNHFKKRNGITHLYFINPEPEKTCFLRTHAHHKYNDKITRITLEDCIKQKKFVRGKELGKTALAIRIVHPYYYKDQLIGYIGLGVEMDAFFKLLKEQTGNEYGLLIKKKFLDESKWASVRAEKKIPNNWNDMKRLLLINETCQFFQQVKFYEIVKTLETMPDEGIVLEKTKIDKKYFVRGIFPFYDAAGRKIGGVFFLKDITTILNAMGKQNNKILLMILVFMGVITCIMVFFHKRAERELRKYRNRLEELVQERTTKLSESNKRLNLEIEDHKLVQEALKKEGKAKEEAEKKQIEAVKHVERSARMASIGVMAVGITHEINQPLNAIKVTADSIHYWHKRNPEVLPEMFIDQLNIISKSVNRIVEIIQHMRSFWVVPHASVTAAVNINQAVKNALSLIREQLHAHGIKETLKIERDPLIVEGDIVHFEQIFANLAVNAINALDEKKQNDKEIEISTLLNENEKNTVMIIKDNGPGLPTEDPEKLFDPFFTTHKNGESMGLGLAIVKRYIDRYNGTIEARNDTEGGAVFTIKFPSLNEIGARNANSISG